jgi:PPK2 family polyphosphate:nucleotide phosphotransferase
MAPSLRKRLAFANGTGRLADIDPDGRPGAPKKRALKAGLAEHAERIASLQERLWAEAAGGGKRRVLLVLQGIDTAGKGGTTEHVVGACGPIGVQYTPFGKPTAAELRHDFLWRIKKRLPPPGVIGIFDRSHYEDVLIVRVHELVAPEEWDARYDKINAFERDLVAHGTAVLKVFLHISYDKQRDRLLRRLKRPDKHWKFNVADLDERALWPKYQEAFQAMLERCDTTVAPWYVVPANSKKYRNWAVAQLLEETLESLDPQYPQLELDVEGLRKRLAPPN